MSRTSADLYINNKLTKGYDYVHQAWIINGVYEACGHPESMECDCYGKLHAGEEPEQGLLDGSL